MTVGGVAVAVSFSTRAAVAVAGALLFALVVAYARLAPAERARSWQPVRDLLIVGGAALVVAALDGRAATTDLRASALVLATGAGATAATIVARRAIARTQSVLLVGDRLAVAQCIEHWEDQVPIDIRGVCLIEQPHEASDRPDNVLGVPVVGALEDAAAIAVAADIDEVIVAPGPMVTAYDVRRLSWALERTHVRVGVTAEVHGAAPRRLRPRLVGRRVVLAVEPSVRPRLQRWLKAATDRVVGTFLLGIFAPLVALLALLVRFDSSGPALFRQIRTGRDGRAFTMYKLRTMCVDAEARLP
ncbi:MAG: sugar transferase, partial [Actinomycetia bacterium]|nr:sugar transferase [Actinomycetes bacterium]